MSNLALMLANMQKEDEVSDKVESSLAEFTCLNDPQEDEGGDDMELKGVIGDDGYTDETDGKNPTVENMKMAIQRRYRRLSEGKRRPSLEYINSEAIREIFLTYIMTQEGRDNLLKMTDAQLHELYDRWYEEIYMKREESLLLNPSSTLPV